MSGDSAALETNAAPAAREQLPTVSVVVPTRDRPEMVKRAVAAILDQNYAGEIECIVVFDQSDPAPIGVPTCGGRRLQLLRNNRTPGLAGARNTGILAASGSLIGFCDDDDEWMQGKLARQVDVLQRSPEVSVVGCGVVMSKAGTTIAKPATLPVVTFDDLIRSRVWELNPCTLLARLDDLRDRVGLVDEELPGSYGEDYDWLLRAARIGAIPMIREPLVRINWHQASFFQRRWTTIIDALTYLLAKHPEFDHDRRGLARILGQIAFAHAACGQRREALRVGARCLRGNWRELRGYLAIAVSLRLITPALVLRVAHARGKGI